ncbi:carbonic anhydrase-related protein 10-like [Macrobrachium rosenbergii]|uniref:carbonic anhydrase-related protein 10-like n=1 Tax=Macrobrachium rosenbergii TaxID=79674 RepID=UPI0034D3B094
MNTFEPKNPKVCWLGKSGQKTRMCLTLIFDSVPTTTIVLAVFVFITVTVAGGTSSSPPGIDWSQWWTYDGISGPRFWGVINPAWGMCRDGRRQSPINVDPKTLLFDPNLTPFTLDKVTVGGELLNTGHSVEWRAARSAHAINITGGPLSYVYTVTHARLHFGERDQQGSEHLLDNRAFPAELQLYGYNSQLYKNFSQASGQVYGVVGIAILVQLGERITPELRVLLEGVDSITYGGSSVVAASLVVKGLLPSTEHYLTYEGSLTEPACHETVTWIIPNKPIYINVAMMRQLRALRQGNSTLANAPIANNFRPIQTAHHRTIRTNIHFTHNKQDGQCRVSDPRLVYRAGAWLGS